MNNCDPTQQQAVQDRLEQLYLADGRDNPDHPMHSLYTGLAQAADEPAVPEGREPAAVAGQPSDEEVLRLAQQYSVVYVSGTIESGGESAIGLRVSAQQEVEA